MYLSHWFFIIYIIFNSFIITFQLQCPKFPNGKFNENVFIEIYGNPKLFIPGSVYTVNIKSEYNFEKFIITLDAGNGGGSLQILNSREAVFAEDCLSTVVERSVRARNQIQILWTSPQYGCATIKVAIKIHNDWLINSKTLCSDIKEQTEKKLDCCSCDHARYKITFEGLWSPESHPKDFPTLLWLTHFSDVIGATHGPNFTMWAEGGLASYGLKQLAEYGIVREMENELRLQSSKLRSIVKAAGLWHPNLNGRTSAVLRVDPRRHLLSLASMFGPSPDWIVGITSLNLCLENCTWLESLEIDLYPYDAGTDNGRTYMSIKTATDPPERIRRITTKFPDDPRSPFYNPNSDEMPPLAKLFIEKDQTITKLCTDLTEQELLEQVSESENTEDENRPECAVTEYSSWSECSVTCGKGLRMRTRNYITPAKAKQKNCDRQLVSKEMCTAAEQKCPGEVEDEEEVQPLVGAGECEVSDWSNWSECSVTCGIGVKLRSRSFISAEPNIIKKCMHITTTEMEKCMLPQCHLNEKKISRACSVTEWSIWSPCSVTCGTGITSRVRKFLSSKPPSSCHHQVNLSQNLTCTAPNCTINQNHKEICSHEPQYGPCRGNFTRWAYSQANGVCETFLYGGCRGNKNNFMTEDECKAVCLPPVTTEKKSGEKPAGAVNCVVSKWSNWSFCLPCTNGTKTKTRTIVKEPRNGGRPCPALSKTIKCSVPKNFCDFMNSYQ